jgi:hypothetical protein
MQPTTLTTPPAQKQNRSDPGNRVWGPKLYRYGNIDMRSVHEYVRRIAQAESIDGGLTIDPSRQIPSGVTGGRLPEPSADLRKGGLVSEDSDGDEIGAKL